MKYLPLFVSVAIILLCGCQTTQDSTSLNEPLTDHNTEETTFESKSNHSLPNDKKLITGKLSNGMTYVIKKESYSKGKASLKLLVKVGALQEDQQQRGVAHFVEHMAFNGTADFPKNDLIAYMESVGMKFGQGINAMTYFDKTIYSLDIPTNKDKAFENGFRILENWAHKVSFDADEIEKERGVILEELRSKDNANYRLESKHLQATFTGSKFAEKYPLIGSPEDIKLVKAEDLIRFYKKWYKPENMVVLAVGDFDPVNAMFFINKYMQTIPSSEKHYSIEKQFLDGNRDPFISIQTDPQATLTNITFQIGNNYKASLTYQDELEKNKQLIIINLLNRRLQNAIRENKIPAIQANTAFTSTIGQRHNFRWSAISNPKQSKGMIKLLLSEIYRASQLGFEEQEVTLVKSAIKNYTNDHKKNTSLSKQMNEYIHHIMNNEPIYSTTSVAGYRSETIDSISIKDINQLLRQWLSQQQNRQIYISAPSSEQTFLPEKEELIDFWKQAETQKYNSYQVNKIPLKLMPQVPEKGSIVKRKYNKNYRSHHWTLSNGAKVILKNRKSKNNSILFQAKKQGGLSQVDDITYQKTAISSNYLDYMGVADFNINTLNTFLFDKNIKLATHLNLLSVNLTGSTSSSYLNDFMQLVYLKFTQPRKDEKDFNFLIANKRAQMEKNSQVPIAQLIMGMNQIKNKHNPRFIEQYDPASLNNIDLELSYQTFKQHFSNASNFTFVFIGELDIKEMENLVTTYIATLPSSKIQHKFIKPLLDKRTKGHLEFHLKEGLDQKAVVSLEMSGEANWSNSNRIIFEAVKSSLNVLLRNAIREKLGGTYNIAVKGKLNKRPYQTFSLSIDFSCEPERVDELVNAVRSELERIKLEGISQDLLNGFKAHQAIARTKSLKNNKFWLYRLSNLDQAAIFDLDVKGYNKALEDISISQVNEIIKTYLNAPNSFYATLLPKDSQVVLTTKQ